MLASWDGLGGQKWLIKFLDHAEEFTEVNWPESERIAKKYRCRVKECYLNCGNIALKEDSLIYCEGYCTHIIPESHAWLVNEKGEVIDPTYCLPEIRDGNVDDHHFDYFGMRLTIKDLLRNRKDIYEPTWVGAIRYKRKKVIYTVEEKPGECPKAYTRKEWEKKA